MLAARRATSMQREADAEAGGIHRLGHAWRVAEVLVAVFLGPLLPAPSIFSQRASCSLWTPPGARSACRRLQQISGALRAASALADGTAEPCRAFLRGAVDVESQRAPWSGFVHRLCVFRSYRPLVGRVGVYVEPGEVRAGVLMIVPGRVSRIRVDASVSLIADSGIRSC